MMQGINNFDPFYDTQQSLETFGEERMSASHRASVGLPPELKNYVRKLLEETENRVEDIKKRYFASVSSRCSCPVSGRGRADRAGPPVASEVQRACSSLEE